MSTSTKIDGAQLELIQAQEEEAKAQKVLVKASVEWVKVKNKLSMARDVLAKAQRERIEDEH